MPDAAAHLVPINEIEGARERLGQRVHRTALMTSATAASWVSAATGVRLADDKLYMKPEHLQKTGSFKARGMINRIETLPDEARSRGVITLSAGKGRPAEGPGRRRGRGPGAGERPARGGGGTGGAGRAGA